MDLDDFLDHFNWLSRVEGVMSSVIHFDKRKAADGPPLVGAVMQIARSATGADAWTFHVVRNQGWTGGDVERLLDRYAIPVWCRRVTGRYFILSVPRRQANWAEYLILRRGMSLEGTLFNPDNQRYAQKYAPGDQPPAWADRGREPGLPVGKPEPRDMVDRLGDLL
jgi:hypothetical protein